MEQRVNIKFCYKLGKTATETHGMLVQVYGTEAVSRKCVYDWFKRFRDGKETTEDEPRSGRPSTSRTPDMIERVRNMLARDRRLTLRLMAEELSISKDTVRTIVRENLGKRKICSRFVPHMLTDDQKAKRKEAAGDLITCVIGIHPFCEPSSQGMRPGATSSIRIPSGNRWNGVHRLPRDPKSIAVKSPRSRQC